MDPTTLPTLNAFLNGAATVLLLLGLRAIKAGQKETHGRFMRAAFVMSALFLASYLYYHFAVIPLTGPTKLNVEGGLQVAFGIDEKLGRGDDGCADPEAFEDLYVAVGL